MTPPDLNRKSALQPVQMRLPGAFWGILPAFLDSSEDRYKGGQDHILREVDSDQRLQDNDKAVQDMI